MRRIDKEVLNRLINEIKIISFNMIDKNDKNDKLIEKYERIHDKKQKI